MPKIPERFQKICDELRIAMGESGRGPGAVKLVVVTKGHAVESIQAVIEAGAKDLGENYVQEALEKVAAFPSNSEIVWHMIGHIQSRKARSVIGNFPWIQSVDSLKLARRLDRFAGEMNLKPSVLLEYNVSGEGSKFGWDASDDQSWPDQVDTVREVLALENLQVRGLMTMAPYDPEPELSRPYYQKLVKLSNFLSQEFGENNFRELSMGMSQDYQVAIQEGATIIRVGQAIMGPRPAALGR